MINRNAGVVVERLMTDGKKRADILANVAATTPPS